MVYQIVSHGYFVISVIATDTFINGCLLHIYTQLLIIRKSISLLSDSTFIPRDAIGKIIPLDTRLRKIIYHYAEVLDISNDIRPILSLNCFMSSCVTIFGLCISLYGFIIIEEKIRFLVPAFYVLLYTLRIFSSCFWAEKCKTACQKIENEIKSINWIPYNKKHKHALIMLLRQVQKNIIFKIPIIGEVSMTLFDKIVNRAISYFLILKSFHDAKK
ncbi:uncharacterized protein LOC123299125 [Chrysoperla carnea]|uniref:uncharacterized protein LOC123299125 n=1 Tax=Chrysoperla carnea TaxID=189513 RepID=UPI001D06DBC2|nr:uncharacterized protein LOC123299125 [Chrysoperla carnea]